jgi:hypothetical protein
MKKWLAAIIVLAAGSASAQAPASLDYKGWALGITRDSALGLAKAQNGQSLDCVGESDRAMYCRTLNNAQPDISIYLSADERLLEMVTIVEPISGNASADSLLRVFRDRWGDPRPGPKRDSTSTSVVASTQPQWLGMWYSAGSGVASAMIMTVGDKRVLGVAIDNRFRYLRGRRPRPKASSND